MSPSGFVFGRLRDELVLAFQILTDHVVMGANLRQSGEQVMATDSLRVQKLLTRFDSLQSELLSFVETCSGEDWVNERLKQRKIKRICFTT